ncbi:hypothetical protein FACS189481_2390 [Clostridia bacterium]|nr:hypothetical protein FACS189481_2390 [Clostridia bacterium]
MNCKETYVVIVPKGATIWDAFSQLFWLTPKIAEQSLTLSFRFIVGGSDKENRAAITQDEAKKVQLCANQVSLFSRFSNSETINMIEVCDAKVDPKVRRIEEAARKIALLAWARQVRPFVPAAACVMAPIVEPGYEVENGLIGLKRDIFLRLLIFAKDVTMVRALFGTCQEALLWRQHSFAQRTLFELPTKNANYENSRRESLDKVYAAGFKACKDAINGRLAFGGKKSVAWFETVVENLVHILTLLSAVMSPNPGVRAQNENLLAAWHAKNSWTKTVPSIQALVQDVCGTLMDTNVVQKLMTKADFRSMKRRRVKTDVFLSNFISDNQFRSDGHYTIEQVITSQAYYLYASQLAARGIR